MRKVWIVGLVCLMVVGASAWAPKKVSAQGLLESFSGVNPLDLGNVRVTASAKVGYQNMGLRFNVPFPTLYGFEGIIRDGNVWVGGLGATAEVASLRNVSAFLNAWGAAPKSARVEHDRDTGTRVARWDWQGNGLTWWELDGGIVWKLREDLSILGGLRRDKFSVGLSDATSQGRPLNYHYTGPGPGDDVNWTSDIQSGEWIFYIGARFAFYGNRSCILVGPAWVDLKVPLRFYRFTDFINFTRSTSDVDAYRIRKPGIFFEANTEQEFELSATWRVKFWGRVAWTKVRGDGSAASDFLQVNFLNGAPVASWHSTFQDQLVSEYYRHLFAGGVSAEWSF